MDNKTLIFINYRQIDCLSLANTLAETFKNRLGKDSYFLDKEDIESGNSITEKILQNIESSKVFLALIGPGWHLVVDQDNDKRLLNSSDWVRKEIEIAKEKGKLIIPVLSKGVDYSKVTDYLKRKVPSLAFMADLIAFPIHSIEADCNALLERISKEKGLRLSENYQIPNIFHKEEQLRNELNKYFPLLNRYQIPKTEIPFVGLDYFKKEDASLFFGRTSEILKICKAVKYFRLTLLYGQSGVGKSSLLNAGVLPRLEDTFKIVYLRRDKTLGYNHQLESLRAEFEGKPILIILDQVEEIYTDKKENWRGERKILGCFV